MVEASSSFPSLSEIDNACLRSNSAINCKTKQDFKVVYLDILNICCLTFGRYSRRAKVIRLGADSRAEEDLL